MIGGSPLDFREKAQETMIDVSCVLHKVQEQSLLQYCEEYFANMEPDDLGRALKDIHPDWGAAMLRRCCGTTRNSARIRGYYNLHKKHLPLLSLRRVAASLASVISHYPLYRKREELLVYLGN